MKLKFFVLRPLLVEWPFCQLVVCISLTHNEFKLSSSSSSSYLEQRSDYTDYSGTESIVRVLFLLYLSILNCPTEGRICYWKRPVAVVAHTAIEHQGHQADDVQVPTLSSFQLIATCKAQTACFYLTLQRPCWGSSTKTVSPLGSKIYSHESCAKKIELYWTPTSPFGNKVAD